MGWLRRSQIKNDLIMREDPKLKELGRTESRHISCKYLGRENECPKECNACEISIKTDADLALSRGSIDEAIALYERAVALEPKFAEAWVNMANAYGMKKNYEKSKAAFDKAIAIDPKYGKALFGKGISLKNLGRLSEALELAQLVNLLYPGNDDVLSFIKNLSEMKPTSKPLPPESASVNPEKNITKQATPAPTGWHLMCSYSASLWQMVSEKRTKECGSRGDASILQSGDYFTPVLKMENHSGYSLPAFTVEYVIDGIERGNWTIDSMDDGVIQSLWLTNKVPQIAANYGHHSIVYSILGHEVCSFSWFIENHKYDWLASLSCSAALQQYKENTYIKRVGLLGRKSLLEKEQYYSPVLTLKNNCMSDTPAFAVKCSIDGHSDTSWANSTIKPGEIRNYKFGFDTAQQYMGIGKHTITYSVFDQVIGKLDWEIKL